MVNFYSNPNVFTSQQTENRAYGPRDDNIKKNGELPTVWVNNDKGIGIVNMTTTVVMLECQKI